MEYSLEEEIEMAKNIAYQSKNSDLLEWLISGPYNECSQIFNVTNERISAKEYVNVLKDKKKVLSVIASGDQILNSVLFGSKDIDGFDISLFPKYYLKLKMAAVESLGLDDYKAFFYGRYPLNVGMYKHVSKELDNDTKKFWDELIINADPIKRSGLSTSNLFCYDSSSINLAEENNPYMEPSNYKELKSKIKNFNLRLFRGDIFELKDEIPDSYDLINLSSIIVSRDTFPPSFAEQKEMLKGFKLNKNGEILTYFYDQEYNRFYKGWEEVPNDDDFKCSYLSDEKGQQGDAILVYKKM